MAEALLIAVVFGPLAVVLVLVVRGVGGWAWPRVLARRWTKLVPVPGPDRRFVVWSREGERIGAIWRHHALMWLAYDVEGRLVGAFGSWPEAAIHLQFVDGARQALREEGTTIDQPGFFSRPERLS